MMQPADRDIVLGYIADMKRITRDAEFRLSLDRLAVEIITADCRPQVMVPGLQKWMGLTNAQ